VNGGGEGGADLVEFAERIDDGAAVEIDRQLGLFHVDGGNEAEIAV
jgi:hypothetical protein